MYTIDYFIKRFSAIPWWKWTTGNYVKKHWLFGTQFCAMGHLGMRRCKERLDPEVQAFIDLMKMVSPKLTIPVVNDGDNNGYRQRTAKGRVLAFLRDIKVKMERSTYTPETLIEQLEEEMKIKFWLENGK